MQDENGSAIQQATAELANVELTGIVENPKKLMENATALAKAFNHIVDKQELFTQIKKKKHVHVDGWSMMGVLLGVFPEVVSTERVNVKSKFSVCLVKCEYNNKTWWAWKLKNKLKGEEIKEEKEVKEIAYKAVVALKTMSGKTISKVEIICSNREDGKLDNDEYSIQSMAQTRGVGKAFRLAFGWIARMAGYDSTPFEEAQGVYRAEPSKPHAPIAVMDDLKKEIEKAKTIAEYRKACERVGKYGNQLNEKDIQEIRDFAAEKKETLGEQQEKTDKSLDTDKKPE